MNLSVEMDTDQEQKLIEDACTYSTTKQYPSRVMTKNEKRSIRRKAEKLVIKHGTIFYKKDGREVGYFYLPAISSWQKKHWF